MAQLTAAQNNGSLTGDSGNDTLDAGTFSNVSLDGAGSGNDLFIIPGDTQARVIGGSGNDTLRVSKSFSLGDSLVSGIENLVYTGTIGASLMGNGGAGMVFGGVGDDTLRNGAQGMMGPGYGSTTLSGGLGNDRYEITDSNVVIVESAASLGGNDIVFSTADYSLLNARNVEALQLGDMADLGVGNYGANAITGNATLNNTLVGLQGRDTIVGGSGNDLIFGAQQTEKLGRVVLSGVDLSGLVNSSSNVSGPDLFAFLADGSMIVQGNSSNASGDVFAKITTTGELDASFGSGGWFSLSSVFGNDPASGGYGNASLSVLQSGKFLVSGLNRDGQQDVFARLNANGTLDTSFGQNGYFNPQGLVNSGETFLARFGDANTGFLVAKNVTGATAGVVFQAFDANGQLAGSSSVIDSSLYSFNLNGSNANVQMQGSRVIIEGVSAGGPVLIRLTDKGVLDSSFGTGGYLVMSNNYDYYELINVTPAGIVVEAAIQNLPNNSFRAVALRFSADGQLLNTLDYGINNVPDEITDGNLLSEKIDYFSEKVNHETLADGSIVGAIDLNSGRQFVFHAYNSITNTYAAPVTTQVVTQYSFQYADVENLMVNQGGKLVVNGWDSVTKSPVFARFDNAGLLDKTFGTAGFVKLSDLIGEDEGLNLEGADADILSDGKFLITGATKNHKPVLARLTTNGQLDTSFGFGGVVACDPFSSGEDFRILSDGSFILVDGNSMNSSITLYSRDGQLVSTFGSDPTGADLLIGGAGNDTLVSGAGVTTMSGGLGDNTYFVNNSANLIIQSLSGGIATNSAGRTLDANSLLSLADGSFLLKGSNGLYKYTSKGALDTSFGVNGLTNISGAFTTENIKILGDGSFFVTGSTNTLSKYTANGVLDVSFGNNGVLTTASNLTFKQTLLDGSVLFERTSDGPVGLLKYTAKGVADTTFGANGFLFTGSSANGLSLQQVLADGSMIFAGGGILFKYSAKGVVDSTFGTNGISIPGFGLSFNRVLADGSMLFTGGGGVTKYTSRGVLDTGFGANGFLSTSSLTNRQVLADGSFLFEGSQNDQSGLIKYTSRGVLDTSFGVNGFLSTSLLTLKQILPDGSILLSGMNANAQPTLLRYTANGQPDATFGEAIGTVYTSVSYNLGQLAPNVANMVATGDIGVSLVGNAFANSIEGAGGNDTISGGTGDTLIGGGGDNLYIVQDANVYVEGNEDGYDTLRSATSFDLRNITNVSNLVYTGTAGASLTGNGGAGSIIGGIGSDTLSDGSAGQMTLGSGSNNGTPTLIGGAGNDRYLVSNSDMVIIEMPSLASTLTGNSVSSTLAGNSVSNSVSGGAASLSGGIDVVVASDDYSLLNARNVEGLSLVGNATLGEGNELANTITGHTSLDNILVGLQGSDTIVGGAGDDVIFGAQFTDQLGTVFLPQDLGSLISDEGGDFGFVGTLADGSMVMESGDDADMFFTKITRSGAVDVSFGNGGMLSLEEVFGDAVEFEDPEASLLADGKFLITGLEKDGSTAYARLTANGKLDTSFGVNGYFVPEAGVVQGEAMIAEFSDGNIGFLVAKAVTGGTRLEVYNKDGKVSGSSLVSPDYNFSDLGSDNSLVLVQTTTSGTPPTPKTNVIIQGVQTSTGMPVLARLGTNGAIDTSFGTNGFMALPAAGQGVSYDYSGVEFDVRNTAVYLNGVKTSTGQTGVMSYTADGKTPATLLFPAIDDIHTVEILGDGRIVEVFNDSVGNVNGTRVRIYTATTSANVTTYSSVTSGLLPASVEVASIFTQSILGATGAANVIIGGWDEENDGLVAARLNALGQLDTTFGVGGYFTIDGLTSLDGGVTLNLDSMDLQVLADGRFLVTGITQTTQTGPGMGGPSTSQTQELIVRLNANGQMDAAFGVNGVLAADSGQGFRVLGNGSILLVNPEDGDSAITLYNKDGKVDATFGSDPAGADSLVGGAGDDILISGAGITTMSGGVGNNTYYVNNSADLIVQPLTGGISMNANGRQLQAGNLDTSSPNPTNPVRVLADGSMLVEGTPQSLNGIFKYNAKGAIDRSFGINGFLDMGSSGSTRAIERVFADGGVLFEGSLNGLDGYFKYAGNGKIDTSFGANGFLYSGALYLQATLNDGSILFQVENNILKYTSKGTIDSTFGVNGVLNTGSLSFSQVLADGSLIFRDGSLGNANFIKYTAKGSIDMTFGVNGVLLNTGSLSNFQVLADGSFLFINHSSAYKYTSNGVIDPTFGVNGVLNAGSQYLSQVLADGSLVFRETLYPDTLIKYTSKGAIDTTFGVNGVLNPGTLTINQFLADGSLLLNGPSGLTKYTAKGVVDTSFGVNGFLSTSSPQGGTLSIKQIFPDGGILLGNDDALFRYNANGQLDGTFGEATGTVYTSVSYNLGQLAPNVANMVATGDFGVSLVGNAFANSLEGGDGNDTISGGAGDTIVGGGGDNLYIVQDASVFVQGNEDGYDTLRSATSFDLRNVENVSNLVYTGTAGASLTGNGGAGSIIGGIGSDTLSDGSAGQMTLGPGSDTLGDGAPTLVGGAGNDRYEISDSDVVIVEMPTIVSTLTGNSVSNSVSGGTASLSGGIDLVVASDDYSLLNARNVEGLSLVGNATLGVGNELANTITGHTSLDNILVGLQGSDTIVGGVGDDVIFGAQVTDKLGTVFVPSQDLGSLISDEGGDFGFVGTLAGGSMVLESGDDADMFFTKITGSGAVDISFGNAGILSLEEVFGDAVVFEDPEASLLPDGKMLITGLEKDGFTAYARLTADGKLDTSFGVNGFFVPESGVGNGEEMLAQFGNGVDGFLVVEKVAAGTRFEVFTADGKLNGSSVVASNLSYDFSILATDQAEVAVQTIGTGATAKKNVVLQGETSAGLPVLMRLGLNGAVDTTFGTGGFLTMSSANGSTTYDYSYASFDVRNTGVYVNAVLTSTGQIGVMSYSADGKAPATLLFPPSDYIQAIEVLGDGRIVEVFLDADDNARVRINAANSTTPATTTALLPNHFDSSANLADGFSFYTQGTNVIIGGWNEDEGFAAVRLNGNTGALDNTFGVEGVFTIDSIVSLDDGVTLNLDNMDLQVLADGRFLVTGITQTIDGPEDGTQELIVRLTNNGQLDSTFGVNGVIAADPGQGFRVLSNGSILLVDSEDGYTTLSLYNSNGKLDSAFGSDPAGADSLVGGAGNDTLISGAGVTTMDGGLGDDWYVVNNSADVIRESTLAGDILLPGAPSLVSLNGNDTVTTSVNYTLGAGVENLIAMADFGLSLAGNSGANSINGGNGNDTIFLGANDTVDGVGGNDLYILSDTLTAATVHLVKWSNGDGSFRDTLRSAVSFDLRQASDVGRVMNVDNLVYTSTLGGFLRGTGSDGIIVGNIGNDTLGDGTGDTPLAEAGTVTLVGGDGHDIYLVENPDVVILEGNSTLSGLDTVSSAVSGYTLAGNVEALILTGTAATGTGNSLGNTLVGNSQSNILVGLDGNDFYIIDSLDDVVVEATGATTLRGNDTVSSGVSGYTLAANAEVLILTGSATTGAGNALANTLIGNSFANTLDGGAGNDSLVGGDGNDYYIVDSTSDSVFESSLVGGGFDTVSSAVINFTLGANIEALELTGSLNLRGTGNSLNNLLVGNAVANTLDGGLGNDTLDGGAGNDSLVGGGGNDFYIIDSSSDVVREDASAGTDTVSSGLNGYTLAANVEALILTGEAASGTGNLLDNLIVGNASTNTLVALDGNDTLDGGVGDDSLVGGVGNDFYIVDSAGDLIVETSTAGSDTVASGVNYTLSGNLEALILTGTATTGTGNTSANALVGNSLANTLDGGIGADTMLGGAGDDYYLVDVLSDVVVESANSGIDTISSGVSYTLGGNVEALILTGTAVFGAGNSLNNLLVGNAVANTLDGGTGIDTLSGGAGNDLYLVDSLGDVLLENSSEGTDTVSSGVSGCTLAGNVEVLLLTGTAAVGSGNDLNNTLLGNSLANTLDGGLGDDTLSGLDGNDFYVIDSTSDVVLEISSLPGGGLDTVLSGVSYTLGSNVEALILTGTASSGTGNGLSNTLVGNSMANTLAGLGGNDFYIIDSLDDAVFEASGAGTDTVASGVNGYTLAANAEVLILAGMANAGTGNILANSLIGNSLANTLDGGDAIDTMQGGLGDDFYVINTTGEVVVESSLVGGGFDTVSSGVSYTLAANVEALILAGSATLSGTGNSLNNLLVGNAAANILVALDGNDTLDGGAGNDSLVGGSGNDFYIIDSLTDIVVEVANSGTDTVSSGVSGYTLAANVESLILTGEATTGAGNNLDNLLLGNSLANTLNGGTGTDTLIGGGGDDFYIIDLLSDVVIESSLSGGGTDTVSSGVNYALGGNVEALILTGLATVGTGNSLNNTLIGNALNNTLNGGTGADMMDGKTGNDYYIVDNMNDVATEDTNTGGGYDTVESRVTGYTLSDGIEKLVLGASSTILIGSGNSLDNFIVGNASNNQLFGQDGNDTIDGGFGADTMDGGAGNDYYILDTASDSVTDSSGNDTIESRIKSYTLQGGVENLVLGSGAVSGTGNSEDNKLVGNQLANTLVGDSGNDTLDGGAGWDVLIGGSGDDYYIIDNIRDRVVESLPGGIDTIEARVSGYILSDFAENLNLFGTVRIGTGNSLDNLIVGNSVNNSINGGFGNDTLAAAGSNSGRGQKDTLTGGVGANYFVLGDGNGFFYDDGNANNAGASDYAFISDFDASADTLVLNGTDSNYMLKTGNDIGVTGMTGTGFYGLFRELGATDELVAVIRSVSGTDLTSANTINNAQFITPIV